MRFAKRFLGVFLLLLPLFLTNTINAFETDDEYTPQVTARVARISFLKGDVQIKRKGSDNWEQATQNLPIVEGDEITTSDEARLEIQFDSYNHLRLAENSYLKITTLRDDGIAVSLPQGTLSLRVSEFDKDKEFFEIDAPKTTLAVQREGMYRIDAGDANSTEIRVTATERGEARIYSGNSGFTLKNGRTAKIFLSGNLEGEWETADASRYADEFDSWTLERDAVIAKRLRDSYYDKYYDRDIYGADDLNDYGEWVYTRKYGYVWKPYASSVSSYSNWSPYRYGHWRWLPPYGWTWVNDEPWGWATYHYGRWVWDNGGWYWSPYGYSRWRRSWWSPALVVVTYSGGYICWYPLPYQYNYYNYNAYYYNTTIINNNTTIVNPTPNPSPTPVITQLPGKDNIPPFQLVPATGVVAVNANEFGKDRTPAQTASANIAKNVLVKVPAESTTTPIMPNYNQLNGKVSKNIVAETPKIVKTETPVKTGVVDRQVGIAMSERIQKERVLDDRTNVPVKSNSTTERDTGAVTRNEQTVKQNPTTTQTNDDTIRPTGGGSQTDRDRTRDNSNNNNNTQQTDRNTQRDEQQTDRNQNQQQPQEEWQRQQEQQRERQRQQEQQQQQERQRQQEEQERQRQQQQRQQEQQQQQQQQKKEEQKPQQQQQQKKEEQKPQQQQRKTEDKDG